MIRTKYIMIILLGLTIVSCNNSSKNVDSNNLSSADTLRKVPEKRTTTNYADTAIYVGQKLNDFISITQYRYSVKKEKIQIEGTDYDIYDVYENGQKKFAVEPDINKPDILWRIRIYGTDLKTENGIGVGSTFADIKTKYQIKNIGTDEGLNITVKDVSVVFLMDNSKLPIDWWNNMDNDKIPENLPIAQIIIWDTKSYLTLDKIIKTN